MKRALQISALILAVMIGLATAACGASSKSQYAMAPSAAPAASSSAAMAEEGEMQTDSIANDSAVPSSQLNDISRKLIRRVALEVETKDFDGLTAKVSEQITLFGGYVESSNTRGRSYEYNNARSSYIVVRLPKTKVDEFIGAVGEHGNIVSRDENTEDVTLQYVDVESRKKALQVQHDRLLALLEKAGKLEDIITLEQRLSDVRYELEQYESQLRTFDNQVDYSTITLSITEVERITPLEEKTVWTRMSNGFSGSLYDIGVTFQNLAVWFVVNLPYLLIIGLLVLAVVLVVLKACKPRGPKPPKGGKPPYSMQPPQPPQSPHTSQAPQPPQA